MSASLVPALSPDRPFPGLRPFDFADAAFFFGRTEQKYSLYRLLERSRFVAVVGGSGSGKSSLVRAGLMPLLDQETQGAGGRDWVVRILRPGSAPIDALARELASLARGDEAASASALRQRIRFDLQRSSFGVADALARIDTLRDSSILLVVDQFEELFRYGGATRPQRRLAQASGEPEQFVQLLLEASRGEPRDVHVLLTMRSDFIGDCARFQGLPEAVSACQFLVPSLTRIQVEEAIREPIENEKVGATIEPGLVERLLKDSAGEEDQLPILQHCLLRLWEAAGRDAAPAPAQPGGPAAESPPSPDGAPPRTHGRQITFAHYETIGPVAKALSKHAEDVFKDVKDVEIAVEQMFRALSEDDKDLRATRRAIPLSQLIAETGVPEAALRRALDRFRDDDCLFLLPSMSAAPKLALDATIDVAHEALLRRWERISGTNDNVTASLAGESPGWLAAEERDGQRYRGILSMVGSKAGPLGALALVFVSIRWWRAQPRTKEWADRYGGQFKRLQGLLRWALVLRWAAGALALLVLGVIGLMGYTELQKEQIAQRNFSNAVLSTNTILSDINRLLATGDITVAGTEQLIKTARKTVDKVSEGRKTPETTALAVNFWLSVSDILSLLGDTHQAGTVASDARALEQPYFEAAPNDPDRLLLMYNSTLRIADAIADQNLGSQSLLDALAEYRKAQSYIDALLVRAPNSTAYRRMQAVMHQKIGDIRLAQENPNAALVEYQAAVDVCNDLIKLAPNYIGGKEELATSVVRLSQAYAKLQNFPEAEKQLRLSLSIRTELLGKDPNNSTLQSHVATSHITLARLLVQSGDWATALSEFDLGLKIREHLAANDASNLQWQSFLASGYMDKAKLFGQQHDLAAALDTYNKALAIRQRAVRQAPLSVPVRQNLAETESAVAGTLAGLSRQSEAKDARWQEAMKIQTDSLAIWKQLLTELPGNIRVQRNLFANHIALGDMLAAQNDQAGALNEYQEALAIAQPLADKASNSKVWAGNVATAKSLIAKLGAVSGTVH